LFRPPTVSLLALAVALMLAAGLIPAGADDSPPLTAPVAAMQAALHCPAAFVHTDHGPVLLVHGTGATGAENWGWNYARALPADGFDVCTVDLPGRAWGDIQVSSEYVVHAVRTMVAATGRRVDIVGHSQGGLEARWAVRWWPDVRADVDDLVTLGTPHHGVVDPDVVGVPCPVPCLPASLWQMRQGSRFLTALNSGDETPGDVSYTSIWSATDELVQVMSLGAPTSVLDGGSNLMVQDVCPGRPVEHVGLAVDAVTFALVVDALTHPGGSDRARFDPTSCLQIGIPGLQYTDIRGDPLGLLLGPLTAERVMQTQEPPLKEYVHL
jgi:pimeloyl-ACP methyl ester carboxylesterase